MRRASRSSRAGVGLLICQGADIAGEISATFNRRPTDVGETARMREPPGDHVHDTANEPCRDDATRPDHGRRLRNSIVALAVVGALVAVLLLSIPGLHGVKDRILHAHPGWLALGVVFELLSCLGYVLGFELVFYRLPRRLAARIAWSELAANTVLSAGGAGGLGLGAWILRSKGVPARRILRRSVAVYLLTSAVSLGAGILLGLGLWLGVLSGPRRAVLTLVPAGVGITGIVLALLIPRWAAPLGRRLHPRFPRLAAAATGLADGVHEALDVLRRPDWRFLGFVAYWLFDVAVLWASFRAIGHAPPVASMTMGYLIGQQAGSLPLPGGLAVVEGGIIGALVLYHVDATPATAATLVFRTIVLWLPAMLGGIAFLLLRRRLEEPMSLRPVRSHRSS